MKKKRFEEEMGEKLKPKPKKKRKTTVKKKSPSKGNNNKSTKNGSLIFGNKKSNI
jgi:hypothetical protein